MENPSYSTSPAKTRLTSIQWLIIIIAVIGFAFDTYALLMTPLIIRPALEGIGKLKFGSPEFTRWRDLFFYAPAVCGGVFGLLGGYLTDRLGRRRVLTWSILVYAISAFASGFATSLAILLILRCTTFIGVCVEFVAAVAWLAELFPNPKQREAVLSYTQVFSSLGGVILGGVAYLIAISLEMLPTIHGGRETWRYLLISGLIPAVPLILIRPFLPESPVWQEKRDAGTLKRPSFLELFKRKYRKTTLVTAAMFACSLAAVFGAVQQTPQIVPSLPEVIRLPRPQQQAIVASVQTYQETGGLIGRFLLAFLAVRIASRRKVMRIFQIPGLLFIPLVFIFPAVSSLSWLKFGIFIAGLLTISQLSFWGNYLPRVYPTHLRGTGESFAANIGGRMIGTSAPLLTTQIAAGIKDVMPDATPAMHLSYAAAAVAFLVFGLGLILTFFLPEPAKDELPE